MAGIQQVWQHPPPGLVKGKTLLESMGGMNALIHFVNVFYDGMLRDKEVAPVLKRSQQTQSEEVYLKLLKERTVEYLECVWGGDAWEGQDMFVAHAALHISTKTYDASMKIAKRVVGAMNMSAEARKAMMDELWALKEPMCDADGKFHAWVHEKNKAIEKKMLDDGAVDLTGMGFTSSPAMVKAMKEKAEKEKERKERMAAQKAKREAEEKERKKQEKRERKEKEKNGQVDSSKVPTPEVSGIFESPEESKTDAKAKSSEEATMKVLVTPSPPEDAHCEPPPESGAADIPGSRACPLLLPPGLRGKIYWKFSANIHQM